MENPLLQLGATYLVKHSLRVQVHSSLTFSVFRKYMPVKHVFYNTYYDLRIFIDFYVNHDLRYT